jgi:hypothetical protein
MRHLNDRFEFRATVTEPVHRVHEREKRVKNEEEAEPERQIILCTVKKSKNDNCTLWRV